MEPTFINGSSGFNNMQIMLFSHEIRNCISSIRALKKKKKSKTYIRKNKIKHGSVIKKLDPKKRTLTGTELTVWDETTLNLADCAKRCRFGRTEEGSKEWQ